MSAANIYATQVLFNSLGETSGAGQIIKNIEDTVNSVRFGFNKITNKKHLDSLAKSIYKEGVIDIQDDYFSANKDDKLLKSLNKSELLENLKSYMEKKTYKLFLKDLETNNFSSPFRTYFKQNALNFKDKVATINKLINKNEGQVATDLLKSLHKVIKNSDYLDIIGKIFDKNTLYEYKELNDSYIKTLLFSDNYEDNWGNKEKLDIVVGQRLEKMKNMFIEGPIDIDEKNLLSFLERTNLNELAQESYPTQIIALLNYLEVPLYEQYKLIKSEEATKLQTYFNNHNDFKELAIENQYLVIEDSKLNITGFSEKKIEGIMNHLDTISRELLFGKLGKVFLNEFNKEFDSNLKANDLISNEMRYSRYIDSLNELSIDTSDVKKYITKTFHVLQEMEEKDFIKTLNCREEERGLGL